MAGSVNKVILVGNLGRDPEVRNTPDGLKVVSLSLATHEFWKDKTTGERRERTEWHRVVIFNERLAAIAEQYCRKGSRLYLEGQLQTRRWNDQEGKERFTTEIVLGKFRGELTLLDGGKGSGMPEPDLGMNLGGDDSLHVASSNTGYDQLNDDIPF